MSKPRDQVPPANERSQMTSRLVAMGYRGQDLATIIRAGRTRGQIAADLIAVQRQAPRSTAAEGGGSKPK